MRYKPEITWHGAPIQGAALAIGIFDGVHMGHQEILKEAMTSGLPVVALTFDPHPTSVFAPTKVPTRLSTLHNRIHQLAMHGATTTAIIKFTEEFSQLTPEEFISEVLIPTFDPQLAVVGENFTFGSKAAGNVDYLKKHAQ